MLRKTWLDSVVRVSRICKLQHAPGSYPGVDPLLYGSPLALYSEYLAAAANVDGRASEVDEDTKAGWESGACVRDGGWIVGYESTEPVLAGQPVEVPEAECGGVSVRYEYMLKRDWKKGLAQSHNKTAASIGAVSSSPLFPPGDQQSPPMVLIRIFTYDCECLSHPQTNVT
jgi:hypothetical protein